MVLALFFLWLVGGHTFKVLISAVVQNKDTGQEERAAGVLMKRCVENLQYGERRRGGRETQSENILPVLCGKAGLALCQSGHFAHKEALYG